MRLERATVVTSLESIASFWPMLRWFLTRRYQVTITPTIGGYRVTITPLEQLPDKTT